MASKEKNVDILMVGKTGHGKSALGNTILQKKNAFQSKNHAESVTQETQYDYSEFEGRIIKVVDGPGVGDTNKDKKKGLKIVVDAMSKAVSAQPEGFHAILIVGRYGVRFTEEEVKSIKILKDIFGHAFIANHGILVMTCGDMFKIDEEENKETFEQWCQNQGGELKELLTEVNNRVILFDNKEKEETACNERIRRLLHMIDGLSRDGTRYTSEIFSQAKLSRNRLMTESKRPFLHEDTIREAGLITQQLNRVENLNPKVATKHLESLKERSEALLQGATEQDKGTKGLAAAIKVAEALDQSIKEQLEQIKKAADLKEKEEEVKKIEEERLLEEKRKEEQRKRDEEEARKRKEEEENRKREEEERRREEERKRREEDERRQKELEKIKNETEKLEALKREEERREKERRKAERREAERREEERQREEERRAEQRRREDEERRREEQRREEERRREEELRRKKEELRKEQEELEKERQRERERQREIERDYQRMKEENSSWMDAAAAVIPTAWNYVKSWWSG